MTEWFHKVRQHYLTVNIKYTMSIIYVDSLIFVHPAGPPGCQRVQRWTEASHEKKEMCYLLFNKRKPPVACGDFWLQKQVACDEHPLNRVEVRGLTS